MYMSTFKVFFVDHIKKKTTCDSYQLDIILLIISNLGGRILDSRRVNIRREDMTYRLVPSNGKWYVSEENIDKKSREHTCSFQDYFRHKLPKSVWNMKCTLTLHRHLILEDSFTQVMAKNPNELRSVCYTNLIYLNGIELRYLLQMQIMD